MSPDRAGPGNNFTLITMKEFWSTPLSDLLVRLNTGIEGLSRDEAIRRKQLSGKVQPSSQFIIEARLLLKQFTSPLTIIMIVAVVLSSALAEFTNTVIIASIIVMTGVMGYFQERKANRAVSKLLDLVKVTATVRRDGLDVDVPKEDVVTGDVIILNAGDMIPADCRLVESNDLHVNEASLTGESFPAEKIIGELKADTPLGKRTNSVFQGTNVINGTARALVVATGSDTVLGRITAGLEKPVDENAFEKGIRRFGYMLMRVTLVMAVLIVMFNIYLERPIVDSFLFGLSLALGMTPELLPAIVTITLSAGASRMADKKVIIKKLQAIQNLGSVNILCADKTGTLTEGIVTVQSTVDINGNTNEKVRTFAYLNAAFETGFTNPLDEALRLLDVDISEYSKSDEVPYDFVRKRLSVVVTHGTKHIMITKGAVKNILDVCNHAEVNDEAFPIGTYLPAINSLYGNISLQGSRTIGVAYKDVTGDPVINKDDETDMIFLGFVVLSDPAKAGIQQSLKGLKDLGISVKLITGDNEKITRHLSDEIGLASPSVLTGSMLTMLTDEALTRKVSEINVFAETEPYQKERIVRALRRAGNVVGFIGDGINDASAMKAADVSISVDTAVDVARETADIVLLEKSLDVLKEGVAEGRKTFANTMKYIFITSSANFGNMLSMAIASMFLPFLPLLPKQILLTNFITDIPAMTLPKDNVELENLVRPTRWMPARIRNLMVLFGAESSVFDLATFALLVYYFKASAAQSQSAWFVESVISEILILLIIRSPRPLFNSSPGKYLLGVSLLLIAAVVYIPFSFVADSLGLVPIQPTILTAVAVIVTLYCIVTEITKVFFFRKSNRGDLS
jgi:Mg2+-importing ATPase